MSQQGGQNDTCKIAQKRSILPISTVSTGRFTPTIIKDRKGFENIPLKSFWDLKTSGAKDQSSSSTQTVHSNRRDTIGSEVEFR